MSYSELPQPSAQFLGARAASSLSRCHPCNQHRAGHRKYPTHSKTPQTALKKMNEWSNIRALFLHPGSQCWALNVGWASAEQGRSSRTQGAATGLGSRWETGCGKPHQADGKPDPRALGQAARKEVSSGPRTASSAGHASHPAPGQSPSLFSGLF